MLHCTILHCITLYTCACLYVCTAMYTYLCMLVVTCNQKPHFAAVNSVPKQDHWLSHHQVLLLRAADRNPKADSRLNHWHSLPLWVPENLWSGPGLIVSVGYPKSLLCWLRRTHKHGRHLCDAEKLCNETDPTGYISRMIIMVVVIT